MQYEQQRQRAIQQCLHVSLRSVTASDDTWRIEMKCALLFLLTTLTLYTGTALCELFL